MVWRAYGAEDTWSVDWLQFYIRTAPGRHKGGP